MASRTSENGSSKETDSLPIGQGVVDTTKSGWEITMDDAHKLSRPGVQRGPDDGCENYIGKTIKSYTEATIREANLNRSRFNSLGCSNYRCDGSCEPCPCLL